jgi:tol-pal system protein YbgF
MGMRWFSAVLLALTLALPAAGRAQEQDQTLADIRAQLSGLYGEIQSLKAELTATGGLTIGTAGNTPLERLDAIEAALQMLTSKTEELEFRINRITVDGTNRIGDLEYRVCELEEGCDVNALGDTPSLGGVDSAAEVPIAAPTTESGTGELAVGEQADFDRAKATLDAGDYRGAADQLGLFVQTYPGGALSSQALYLRGTALEALGETSNAARAYLDAFSGDPDGPAAPDALFKLGMSLAALGQNADACVTLREVPVRFPGAPVALEAQSAMRNLGCP